jgi:hypothetical protein
MSIAPAGREFIKRHACLPVNLRVFTSAYEGGEDKPSVPRMDTDISEA